MIERNYLNILAASSVTHFYSLTKAVSKQILPVYLLSTIYINIIGYWEVLINSMPLNIVGFQELLGAG